MTIMRLKVEWLHHCTTGEKPSCVFWIVQVCIMMLKIISL